MLMKPIGSIGVMTLICWTMAVTAVARMQSEPSVAEAQSDDVVVIGRRPPRCRPNFQDPQNAADLTSAVAGSRQMLRIDPTTGRWMLVRDEYPETGPATWQRAAQRMDRYVFLTPTAGDTVCIGARAAHVPGEAQLRRAFSAKPYWGEYLVLSAFVAARDAGRVDMWVAAGARDPRPRREDDISRDIVAGGAKQVPITGDYRWRQVNFLIGPIPCMAAQISYGVQLQGSGEVWLARPALVRVPEDKLSPSMKLRPHGAAMLRTDPVCRHFREGRPLWERYGGGFREATDDDVVPTNALFDRRDDPFRSGSDATMAIARNDYNLLSRAQITALGLTEF